MKASTLFAVCVLTVCAFFAGQLSREHYQEERIAQAQQNAVNWQRDRDKRLMEINRMMETKLQQMVVEYNRKLKVNIQQALAACEAQYNAFAQADLARRMKDLTRQVPQSAAKGK